MKILILEYVTGGGMRGEPILPSLALEGARMLGALIEDLLALTGVELAVLIDDRLTLPRSDDRLQWVKSDSPEKFREVWLDWIGRCDAVWPIAPETGGILERLCLDVEAAGKPLLSCPPAAVQLCAGKLGTARRLAESGLPAVPTLPLTEWEPKLGQCFVIKPDDGVGCEGARIVRDLASFSAPSEGKGWIVQPLLEGDALSLSVLFAHGKARLLSCNRQWIDRAGEGFSLHGCEVNAVADEDGSWQALAECVARAIPELWGYAGIDLILSGEGPVILEVNPRLTTSYVGLRLATGENPAAHVLNLLRTGALPPSRTDPGKPVDIRLEKDHVH